MLGRASPSRQPSSTSLIRGAAPSAPTRSTTDAGINSRQLWPYARAFPTNSAARFYAVVETPNGTGYHVPLDRTAAESLCEGDLVSLTPAPDTPGPPARPPFVLRKHAQGLEEQVQALQPVPLDALHRETLAPWGFGADLRRALDRRELTLRRFGIDPADPERLRKLRDLGFPGRDLGR